MPAEKVTANQALFNASVRHQVHVLRFSEKQAELALETLRQAEQELLEKITGAMAKGIDTGRLESLLSSVQKRRQQVYAQLADTMEEELKLFSAMEADWEVGALDGASPVRLNTASVPLEQLHATVSAPIAGIPLKGWLNNIAASEASAIQAAVTQAVIQGGTIDDLVRRIRGTKAKGFADGILSVSTRNAQALARTAVNHVSNSSRELVWQANSDIVRCLRWTSTLDGRTSPICRSRDGHMATVGDTALLPSDQPLIPDGARPPAHFNCRSLLVAVLDGVELAGDRPFVKDKRVRKDREAAFRREAKERGVPIQQVRKEWADKNVGQVPSSTTYGEWLKTQPAEFQDEVLGHARAEMFRSGIPLERFVDKSGRSLTLAELKLELSGDSLNVLQPAIGVKAKGLLMQGLSPEEVLGAIKNEFPDASTSVASIASYKSELNKAGLLPGGSVFPSPAQKYQNLNTPGQVNIFEAKLAPGVKNALQGQWATVVETLDGHPGAYAHYKPGTGVVLSDTKLMGLTKAQAQQVMAHELAHMLDKVHDVNFGPITSSAIKQTFDELPKDVKKLYSYYGASKDELWAEVLGQALHDSPVTSQGVGAGPFKQAFGQYIDQAKMLVKEVFPDAPPVMPSGPVLSGLGEIAGKPTSIGGYAKALLQQGLPDDHILTAIKAEFPDAKTTKASIASYKSQLKKTEQAAIGKSGPTVKAQASASIETPKPLPPTPSVVSGYADPAAQVAKPDSSIAKLSGLAKTGGKPGGSNPGALYKDIKGDEWLVKGNLQKANGQQPLDLSNARAKNEVLTSELIRTVDKGLAPEMRLVDLEGEYGGGLGVMSKMLGDPIVKFNPKNAIHVAVAQEDFAMHAWLGNWDVVGASFDNLVIKGGKAVNIDPGGALLFRAQGTAKDLFDDVADEWNSMRKAGKNANAAAVYGNMTDAQLVASAKRLMVFTDAKIDEMVDAFGPGIPMSNEKLKTTLKLRRDDILQNVGLKMPKPATLAPPAPATNPLAAYGVSDDKALQLQSKMTTLSESGMDFKMEDISDAILYNEAWIDEVLGLNAMDIAVEDFQALVQWKPGVKVSSADPALLAAKKAADKAQKVQAKAYKKMSPKELMDALVPPELEIKSYFGKTKISWTVQKAAVPLFKSGISTDMVKQALDLKFGEQYVPKATSLASMKSKLKKQGLLDGPIGAPMPDAASNLVQPKLWGVNLGNKSTTVKEGAKNMIQQGHPAKLVTDWITTQFSSPDMTGAANLYELAYYEIKTGKVSLKKGAAAVTKNHYGHGNSSLPAPVPLRPATRVNEAGPPPPRFTPEGHRAGLQKYGGSQNASDTSAVNRINTMQRAARLEELTPEEYGAIKAYTNSSYSDVNRKLRDGLFASDVYLQAWTDAAMQGLWKLPPWSGNVTRGISVGGADLAKLKKFYRPGATVMEDAFLSTSDASKGHGFGGNVRYNITTKSGRDVRSISSHKSEQEILLAPGTTYKVTKVEDKGDLAVFTIWMEEV